MSDNGYLVNAQFLQQDGQLLAIVPYTPCHRRFAAFSMSGKIYRQQGSAVPKAVLDKGEDASIAAPAVKQQQRWGRRVLLGLIAVKQFTANDGCFHRSIPFPKHTFLFYPILCKKKSHKRIL